MSAITIESDLVHYEVLGRGRPVIFVHGWLGSWRYWIPAMQQLSAKYRTYALDLWGFGDSGRNAKHYELKDQVQLLHDFMEKLGITKAALVGHSLGAAICLRYATLHPDRAPRLALISAPLFDLGGLDDAPVPVAVPVAVPANNAGTTPQPTATPVPAASTPTVTPSSPVGLDTNLTPPTTQVNSETLPRNPFRGLGETPEEILARLQAKNVVSSAGIGAPPSTTGSAPAQATPAPAATTTKTTTPESSPATPPAPTPAPAPAVTPASTPASAPVSSSAPTPAPDSMPSPDAPKPPDAPTLPTGIAKPILPQTGSLAPMPGTVPNVTPTVVPSPSPTPSEVPNPLLKVFTGKAIDAFSKYVERDAPDHDKLRPEVEKADESAIIKSVQSFNGVNLAAELHRLAIPTLLLHGKQDPVLNAPSDDLLDRIGKGKAPGHLITFIEDDLRHFPMLELGSKFNRLLQDFLDTADLTNLNIQFKEQWRRTMR
jgi:pimeloyl-ACP methyl ester carboxylesterase